MNRLMGFLSFGDQFRKGMSSPRTYLDESLKRIAELDPEIGAFVAINQEDAIQAADAATARWDAGVPKSLVDGMPIAVKDTIETADMPTGQGSPLWQGTQTRRDSASVRALREAGAIILGKTTTTEFAATHSFHTTRNPNDLERTPGGSSSGSAAAVAAGMVPFGLSSQVVGSTLRPASFCGAVGFKPSYGAINRGGSNDSLSQSSQGAISATLVDLWAPLRVIAGRVGGDPGFVGLSGSVDFATGKKPTRLVVLETEGWACVGRDALNAWQKTIDMIDDAGIELRGRRDDANIETLERSISVALELSVGINAWEGRWPLNTYADLDSTRLSADSIARLQYAETMTQNDYSDLLSGRAVARAAFANSALKDYDGFVTLGACGAAPVGFASTGDPRMNVAASLLGCPSITLPLMTVQGLPLGLQLLSLNETDASLIGMAAWICANVFDREDLIGLAS